LTAKPVLLSNERLFDFFPSLPILRHRARCRQLSESVMARPFGWLRIGLALDRGNATILFGRCLAGASGQIPWELRDETHFSAFGHPAQAHTRFSGPHEDPGRSIRHSGPSRQGAHAIGGLSRLSTCPDRADARCSQRPSFERVGRRSLFRLPRRSQRSCSGPDPRREATI